MANRIFWLQTVVMVSERAFSVNCFWQSFATKENDIRLSVLTLMSRILIRDRKLWNLCCGHLDYLNFKRFLLSVEIVWGVPWWRYLLHNLFIFFHLQVILYFFLYLEPIRIQRYKYFFLSVNICYWVRTNSSSVIINFVYGKNGDSFWHNLTAVKSCQTASQIYE